MPVPRHLPGGAALTPRARLLVIGLVLVAILAGVVLLSFIARACPGPLPGQPCAAAGTNRAIVIALAGVGVAALVTPFAFLAEFALRRRIVYIGAWARAARRGSLGGVLLAVLAALRIGDALSIPVAAFFIALAAALEWLAIRRFDRP